MRAPTPLSVDSTFQGLLVLWHGLTCHRVQEGSSKSQRKFVVISWKKHLKLKYWYVIYKIFFLKRITWFTAQSVLNPYTNDSGIKNVEDFDFYKYLTKTKYHIHIVIRVYDMYMPLCIIHKYKCLKTNELCYLLTAKTIYHLLYKLFQGFFGGF